MDVPSGVVAARLPFGVPFVLVGLAPPGTRRVEATFGERRAARTPSGRTNPRSPLISGVDGEASPEEVQRALSALSRGVLAAQAERAESLEGEREVRAGSDEPGHRSRLRGGRPVLGAVLRVLQRGDPERLERAHHRRVHPRQHHRARRGRAARPRPGHTGSGRRCGWRWWIPHRTIHQAGLILLMNGPTCRCFPGLQAQPGALLFPPGARRARGATDLGLPLVPREGVLHGDLPLLPMVPPRVCGCDRRRGVGLCAVAGPRGRPGSRGR